MKMGSPELGYSILGLRKDDDEDAQWQQFVQKLTKSISFVQEAQKLYVFLFFLALRLFQDRAWFSASSLQFTWCEKKDETYTKRS